MGVNLREIAFWLYLASIPFALGAACQEFGYWLLVSVAVIVLVALAFGRWIRS